MTSTTRTSDRDGFIRVLQELIIHARAGNLVAVSVNLDPTGLGRYSFELLDGAADPDLSELADETITASIRPKKRK